MKALFLALLLGNFLFFAWSRWHTPAQSSEALPPTEPTPTLKLAEEVRTPAKKKGSAGTEAASATSSCVSIGPFYDLPEASEASVSLRGLGFGPKTRVDEGDIWAGLWVYLEDLPSRAEAVRVMEILKRNGMSDAYIMPSTEDTNDISLGIFSEIPRAQRRAAEVRKLGFIPAVAERTRKGTVYWLDVEQKPGGIALDPADLHRVRPEGGGAIVRLEVKSCPST